MSRVRSVNKLTLTSSLKRNNWRNDFLRVKMTDFFKSAFSVLTGNVAGTENDFVGQTVELGQQKLRVRRVVAEGTCTVDIIRFNTHHHRSVLYLSVVKSKIIHEYHFFNNICYICTQFLISSRFYI